mmetsp:Transcript_48224/g.88826  ORF Transcript_48224/g.88826 Transcript_48224/m.88826 type:complete len:188 (+) Transcript_48224:72-635(+)
MVNPDCNVNAAQQTRERISRRRSWRAASIVLSVAFGGSARAFATTQTRQVELAKAARTSPEIGISGCTQALAKSTVRSFDSLAVSAPWKASGRPSRRARAVVARRAAAGNMPDVVQELMDIIMVAATALAPVLVPWAALLLYAIIASFFSEAPEPALGTETDEVRSKMGRKQRVDLKRPTLDYWKDV